MRRTGILLSLGLLMVLLCVSVAASADGIQVSLGHSTVPVNGPWRFHTGDNAQWSATDFDDSDWETVDLTPAPGAHDGDVGLPGYVTGWSQRGHAGYTGYAWYRVAITVDSAHDLPLALAGPTLVDSTYELYVDGKRLGGSGDFSHARPTVFGVRPSVFALPSSPGPRTYVVAFRVWMDPIDAGAESGGIHVAPVIGDAASIDQLYQLQWLQTFKGYVVDAIEPLAFVLLAIMMCPLMAGRAGHAYRWMVVALLLLALLRVNQVLFYWTSFWSLRSYDIAVTVVLRPLVLWAWTLAWRDWFGVRHGPWLGRVLGVLAAAYVLFAWLGRPWLAPDALGWLKPATDIAIQGVRLVFAALYLWVIVRGVIRRATPSTVLAALAAILVGVGLFATELNALGIPGIWFPYGTGVARGQYAYAAFIVLMFGLILKRLARRGRET